MAERVAVAMSGGVDSSLAAALLLEQGYDVVGLTMQIWPRRPPDQEPPGLRGCCGLEAIHSAQEVARRLGIRHYVLNLREPFERHVIAPFCDAYARGLTPNPCLWCNTRVKFSPLLQRAREIGASRLATGHYARLAWDETTRRWQLRRGVDEAKDQSYHLYALDQEQLAHALFPLGAMTKEEVRRRARQLRLPAADRPESRGVCFLWGEDYRGWLVRRRPQVAQPGPMVDREGRQLGRHRGIVFYTIGQRRGLGLNGRRPHYVVEIDAAHNRVVVGGAEDLCAAGLIMREVRYGALAGLPEGGARLAAKIRARAAPAPCLAEPAGDSVRLRFAGPQRAVAPGQAAVCYDGEAVALGGTIERTLREEP